MQRKHVLFIPVAHPEFLELVGQTGRIAILVLGQFPQNII